MRSSRRCSSMRSGAASRASCCCRRTATASSTCSIASTGALLLAKPFVKKLTWAREIGADGRPVLNDGQTPTAQGTKVCPAVEGATNWFSTSFSATTGLYYVQALEKCTIFSRSPETWRPGKSYYCGRDAAGARRAGPEDPARDRHRAPATIRWEVPQVGRASTWGGTLATAGGLVFFGDDSGALSAVDAADGKRLWQFRRERGVEGVADDLRLRSAPVHRRRGRPEHHRVRAALRGQISIFSPEYALSARRSCHKSPGCSTDVRRNCANGKIEI